MRQGSAENTQQAGERTSDSDFQLRPAHAGYFPSSGRLVALWPFAGEESRSLNLNTDVLIAQSPSARTPSAAHHIVSGQGVRVAVHATQTARAETTRVTNSLSKFV